ncbi:hypothetical protein Tco_0051097, partial [Tanacetum coccineum]
MGYPVGHPLHGKYKPPTQRNNVTRSVNLAQTSINAGNSQEGVFGSASSNTNEGEMAMSARMDQLQNQLNQMMMLMQQNSKESTVNGPPNSATVDSGATDHVRITLTSMHNDQYKRIAHGTLCNGLYIIKQEKPTPQSLISSVNNLNHHLWHARLEHPAYN